MIWDSDNALPAVEIRGLLVLGDGECKVGGEDAGRGRVLMTPVGTSGDSRFSKLLPGLQVQVNSSSLGPFKLCPRRYYYEVILGLESEDGSVHLDFGTLVHNALGGYQTARLRGIDHETALHETVRWALRATWNSTLKRGWLGNAEKNRLTLLRTIVWYCDHYTNSSGLETVQLTNGSPAIELDFALDSGYTASTGESVQFIGRLDQLAEMESTHERFVVDTKTTTKPLGQWFFGAFNPDNQFSLYAIAARVGFGQEIRGIIIDGVQVGVGFSRFGRSIVPRSEAQLDEWLEDTTQWWLPQMNQCAERQYWPQNDKSCGAFGGCPFRELCKLPPGQREQWQQKLYRRRGPVGTIVEDRL